jgi:hypothetical protein
MTMSCTQAAPLCAGVIAALVGCGSSPAPAGDKCGPGTLSANGVCVVADASAEGAVHDAAALDAGDMDASLDVSSQPEASGMLDSTVDDGGGADAGPDDPCPTHMPGTYVNCNTDCGGPRGVWIAA